MKTTSLDPLIQFKETSEETLTRLSVNIGTLTGLMNEAERTGHYYLSAMFNQARDAQVAQAQEIIARVTASAEELADDRRFLLVRRVDSVEVASVLPRQKPVRLPAQLALTT